jgi:hypothetical protein
MQHLAHRAQPSGRQQRALGAPAEIAESARAFSAFPFTTELSSRSDTGCPAMVPAVLAAVLHHDVPLNLAR